MGRTGVPLDAGEVAGQGKALPRRVVAHAIDVYLKEWIGLVCVIGWVR